MVVAVEEGFGSVDVCLCAVELEVAARVDLPELQVGRENVEQGGTSNAAYAWA